jgi:hypothetical protein
MSQQEHHVPPPAEPTPRGPGGPAETALAWGTDRNGGTAAPEDAGRQGPDPWEGYSIEVLRAVLDP